MTEVLRMPCHHTCPGDLKSLVVLNGTCSLPFESVSVVWWIELTPASVFMFTHLLDGRRSPHNFTELWIVSLLDSGLNPHQLLYMWLGIFWIMDWTLRPPTVQLYNRSIGIRFLVWKDWFSSIIEAD